MGGPPGPWGQPPQGYVPAGWGPPPQSHLVWAILSTIFCCLPAGIVSIVYAAQVNSKHAAGDVAGAQESSRRARTWAIVSAAVGGGFLLLYLLAVIVFGVATGFEDF